MVCHFSKWGKSKIKSGDGIVLYRLQKYQLGATSNVKIGEVRLSGEIGGVGTSKKPNFIITIRYKIPTFVSVGPFFEEGGRGSRKFRREAEILGIFSIEVAP